MLIGRVLRTGVVISISIVFFGGIVYLYRHGHSVADYREFKGVPDFVKYNARLFREAFNLKGQAIIQLGIILLIATPVLRIIFSAIGFAFEKDYLYLGISILVLFIIAISAIDGHAG